MNRMWGFSGGVLAMALGATVGGVFAVDGGTGSVASDAVLVNGEAVNPTRVLVKMAGGNSADALAGLVDAESVRTLRATGITIIELRRGGADAVQAAIDALQASGLVEYAEPDYKVSADLTPNDPRFSELWGLHNTGQTGGTADADIDAPQAWDMLTASDGVVMVIDTGVDYTHEDLAANIWTNPGEIPGNGVDDDGNGFVDDLHGINAIDGSGDPMDDNDHGSHVSGTIGAAGGNGVGVVGVNWSTRIAGCKFLNANGRGNTSDAITCLDYAIDMKANHGVDFRMTSNSWGGGLPSQAMYDAIAASGAADMLFVAAAGNSAVDTDTLPHFPSSYALANILSVASTTDTDDLSSFSNYGLKSVDLGAPGSEILSTIPGDAYALFSGTSMATPHVTGAAMLAWTQYPSLSALEVKDLLMITADDKSALQGRTVSGGRLNVYQAVSCGNRAYSLSSNLADGFEVDEAVPTLVTARLESCTWARGAAVEARLSNGDATVPLLDDGVAPDRTANDGLYTGEWTPTHVGPVTMTVAATYGGQVYQTLSSGKVLASVAERSVDITLNNQDGLVLLIPGVPVSLDLWFDAAEQLGQPGEYFVAVASLNGVLWLDSNFALVPQMTPVYAGPQFNLEDYNLGRFQASAGAFGYLWLVDSTVNGVVDVETSIADVVGYYAALPVRQQPSGEAAKAEVDQLLKQLRDLAGK